MNVVHIVTFLNGGAGRAAYRLHQSLSKVDKINSSFFCMVGDFPVDAVNCYKYTSQSSNLANTLKKLKEKFFLNKRDKERAENVRVLNSKNHLLKSECTSLPYGIEDLLTQPCIVEADVINLHWISFFVDYQTFFSNYNKPIVWTLHDMNPFLGLFHYKNDEERNKPLIGELDEKVKILKKEALKKIKSEIAIVTPSAWLSNEAKQYNFFSNSNHYIIPYSLDYSVFKFNDKNTIKKNLNIDSNRFVLLFISQDISNFRKGFDILFQALALNNVLPLTVLAIGEIPKEINWEGVDVRLIGLVNENGSLADYYSAADAFVLPSREDNLPNVMLESFACGTPIIGFEVGGIKQYVINYKTGLLAGEITAQALSNAIQDFLKNREVFDRNFIRQFAKDNFNDKKQADSYLEVYKALQQ